MFLRVQLEDLSCRAIVWTAFRVYLEIEVEVREGKIKPRQVSGACKSAPVNIYDSAIIWEPSTARSSRGTATTPRDRIVNIEEITVNFAETGT